MALELIEIKDFPRTTSVTGSGDELIVVSKADGKTYGIKTSDFKAFLGTVQVTTPKPLTPTDPAPTLDGVYIPTESGTYPDGIIVNLQDGYNQLILSGGYWVKVVTPIDLSTYLAKSEIETKYINQLFREDDYLQDFQMANSGSISAAVGGQVTGKIYWEEGNTHVTISGTTGTGTKRIIFFNENDVKVGVTGEFTSSPYTRIRQAGGVYFRVMFHNPSDAGSDVDTLMVNFGQTALPYEDGIDVLSKVKGYPVQGVDTSSLVTKESLRSEYYDKEEIDNMDFGVPEYVDDRYISQFSNMDKIADLERLEDTVKSLRGIKGVESGEVSHQLLNPNTSINEAVVVPVNIHWGVQSGDAKSGEIYMNENSRKDFTDIRFTDPSGNLLDAYKVSNGNYEFIYDDNIRQQIIGMPNGDIFGSNVSETSGVWLSDDNMATWTQIRSTGVVMGINANDDLFIANNGIIYKRTSSSGYVNESAVLSLESGVSWRYQSWAKDDIGYLYAGAYQTEFNMRLYRSTDGGDNWDIVLSDAAQHVHSIVLDKSTTPNRIFVNIDGAQWESNGTEPKTMFSLNRGVTWQQMTFFDGINPDFGVLYAKGNVLLGSGEGDIKGYPSIYKTTDFGATWRIVMNASVNMPIMTEFKGALYAMNFARGANTYPTIYRSDDEGDNWTTIQNVGSIPVT